MSEGDGREPLAGRSILLTRSGRSRRLADRLRRLGAMVDARPTVAMVEPSDPEPCRAAIAQIDRYDWILFTSANGARFFVDALRTVRSDPLPVRVGAIGQATAALLADRGMPAGLVAGESDSEGFAAALAGRIDRGARVLLVRPEVARNVLPQALRAIGAELDSVAFYRNVPSADVREIARDVGRGRYDVIVFHSPSALSRLLEAGEDASRTRTALRRSARVAIGRVTASALEEAGLGVSAIASSASDDGVVEAILTL